VNLLKRIGPWIVSAALCLLATEIVGVLLYYRNANSLVYFNARKANVAVVEPSMKRRLHPYFGYIGPYSYQGSFYKTNNLGFTQIEPARDVPFVPEPDDFVVFVFGGSVASRLVNPEHGGTSVRQALQRLPQLAGKKVVVYNMAQGPGKQPQQLMELAYLIAAGQHIDLVLSLDGALEFGAGLSNFEVGVDPIFPPASIMLAIGNELTPIDDSSQDYYELAYGVMHARAESRRYTLLLEESRSGIAYVKNRLLMAVYDRILQSKLGAYDQTVVKATGESVRRLLGLDMPMTTSKQKVIEDIFNMWLRSSDLMKAMTNSVGARYLNVVHPNAYHSKKSLTDAERKILSLPEAEPMIRGGSAGYALIESHTDMLTSRGIVSATTIFDDIPDTIYADKAGHFGKRGETMLAEFVAERVGMILRSPHDR
jgi:hypothetical protein